MKKHPGVKRTGENLYLITGDVLDPRTGRRRQFKRQVSGTLDEAVEARHEEVRRIQDGGVGAERQRRSVSDCGELWLELKKPHIDEGTRERYLTALSHINGRVKLPDGDSLCLGNLLSDAVTRDDVQRWVNAQLAREYSRETVHGWYRVLRTLVRARPEDFKGDPTVAIQFPPPAPVRRTVPTDEQLAAFYGHMRAEFYQDYVYTYLKGMTGQRGAHVLPLKWSDLDRERKVIRFERKVVHGRIGPISARKPAPEEVPLTDTTIALLDEYWAYLFKEQSAGMSEGWMFPAHPRGRAAGYTGPRSAQAVGNAWAACRKAAGIGDDWTPHRTRGRFYDLHRAAGGAPDVGMDIVGHAEDRMRRGYSTVSLEERRRAVEAVEARLVPEGKR